MVPFPLDHSTSLSKIRHVMPTTASLCKKRGGLSDRRDGCGFFESGWKKEAGAVSKYGFSLMDQCRKGVSSLRIAKLSKGQNELWEGSCVKV